VQIAWPELSDWAETRDTLHIWTQVAGKVRLALEPMVNHWWQVPLYLSSRGLTTTLMHRGAVDLEMEFDLNDHLLEIRTCGGEFRKVEMKPRSVADFYAATMTSLQELGVTVRLLARPVEVPDAIPFAEDTRDRSYDAAAAHRFWVALRDAHRVMARFRGGFCGKASPVHFFWGGFDLAVTRFSGRPAPRYRSEVPNCADWVMELAYSHEVSSCGFWPGGSPEGSFYAYAYPEPQGFADWKPEPAEAFYDHSLGEFILPYTAVRTAADPDAKLLSFLQSTYEAAAELGHWDRAALEIGGRL